MIRKLRLTFQNRFRRGAPSPQPEPMEPTVNAYGRQLSDAEIAARDHRAFVGGLWEEVGQLQFEFLKSQGLLPAHRLADVGCGAMRGGLHFVRYLDAGNYFGLDINASLIQAARAELKSAGLMHRAPVLLVNDKFQLSRFGTEFDFAIAVSVFTHLFMNHITRCLVEVGRVLRPAGRFYATFFQAPQSAHLDPIVHAPGGITTYYDRDPFHCSLEEMQGLAAVAGLDARLVEEWSHPRDQKMVCFTPRAGQSARV